MLTPAVPPAPITSVPMPRILKSKPPKLVREKLEFGTLSNRSLPPSSFSFFRVSAEKAVTAIGVSCRFVSRRSAVTTSSPMVVPLSAAAPAAAAAAQAAGAESVNVANAHVVSRIFFFIIPPQSASPPWTLPRNTPAYHAGSRRSPLKPRLRHGPHSVKRSMSNPG